MSQSKVLDPEYFLHLFSQSVGPLKLIEVVPNDGATIGPLVERVELQVDVRDVLRLLLAQILQFEYLFIQQIQFVLVRRSPSRQLLSRVQVVAPQSRAGLPGVVELGKAIHPFFDLTHGGGAFKRVYFDDLGIEARTVTSSNGMCFCRLDDINWTRARRRRMG